MWTNGRPQAACLADGIARHIELYLACLVLLLARFALLTTVPLHLLGCCLGDI